MDENRLYTTQRRNEILKILEEQGSISVGELVDRFRVSGTTIRIDLTALEKTGSVTRTHGGAMLGTITFKEPLMRERKNHLEKESIAHKALSYIDEHDIILIDTGTTMLALAKALAESDINHLTVYSNDLTVLRVLEKKEDFELHLLGGRIRNGFHYTFGNQVITELGHYYFKKLFLATSAISLEHGLTTASSDLAALKSKMIASSDQVYLLTDSTKLHHVAFQRFAELSDIDTLITDSGLEEKAGSVLGDVIKNVVIVPKSE